MAVSGETGQKPWLLHLVCCGRDDGTWPCATWEEADEIRQSYVAAEGHERSAIITEATTSGGGAC
jgi:hypothetical protein